MADTRALFTQRFAAARTALTAGDEPAAAESLHAAIVVARSDPDLRLELASALFQLGKLSRKFGRAGETEAETLLSEALAVSEALFGREHTALAPLLNELIRLHVQRSQHAQAEDLLERLLAIARSKSEENADVATALAGLALVKRKLGDDASAEALYRDALRIREKVLEPSHMVTVVTQEQLSETCAARGNFAEALTLLKRALATREVALGPGHSTVQAARSRVAELELRVAVAADTEAAAAAKAARAAIPTPVWLKRVPNFLPDTPTTRAPLSIDSKELELVREPELRVVRPAPSRDRATPTVAAAVAAASLMASSIQTPVASQIVISPPESTRPSESVAGHEPSVTYRDVVVADVVQSDVASDAAALDDAQSTIALTEGNSLAPVRTKRTALYLSLGVAAVAMAAFLMLRPRGRGDSAPISAQTRVAPRTTVASAGAVVGAARADSLRSAAAVSAPTAAVVQPEQRASDTATPAPRLPRVDVQLRRIDVPETALPSIAAVSSVDSIARSAAEKLRASDSDRTGTGGRALAPTSLDLENAVTPAKIVGHAPAPLFPDALLRAGRREGQVVVRFMVNERGRVDVASMVVEQSDDEQFTSAVRDILPGFRFEPARTSPPESKPVASWVSVPFRFTTKKK